MCTAQTFLVAMLISSVAMAGERADRACIGVDSGSYTIYNQCSEATYQEAEDQLQALLAEDRTCELASWIEGYVYAPARRSNCMVLTRRRVVELKELHQCIKSEGYGGDCPFSQ